MIDFEEDSQEAVYLDIEVPDDSGLSSLQSMVMAQIDTENTIHRIQDNLSRWNERLRYISEVLIPDKMMELGISDIKLSDGRSVKVSTFYNASIQEESKEDCFMWLRSNGMDDIIKHNIAIDFKRGEDEKCLSVIDYLISHGFMYSDKEMVHPQTLKAFVKEQIDSGNTEFPKDLFNVYIGRRSTIKTPK